MNSALPSIVITGLDPVIHASYNTDIDRGRPIDGRIKSGMTINARRHVRLKAGRSVSQYAGSEGCTGLAGAEPQAYETGLGGSYHVCRA
jgi:hypothetical protein